MTKPNFVSINILLDESGSMAPLINDTLEGLNHFINEQKKLDGEVNFSLTSFSTMPRELFNFVKLSEVPKIDSSMYSPGGGTALLDALGDSINSLGKKLAGLPEDERPSRVLFLIITDGEENMSRKFVKSKIKEMVEHQTQKYSWDFVFMGANIDSFHEGSSIGMNSSFNYSATSAGTKQLFNSITKSTTRYRSGGSF